MFILYGLIKKDESEVDLQKSLLKAYYSFMGDRQFTEQVRRAK